MDAAAANGAPLLQPGQVLAEKYRVVRLIGRGGMAEVYAAYHELLHQTVALKLLLPELASFPQAAARFLNEARAAARIRGENIATVMDVGTLGDGTAFIVLEYLEGRDLEAYAVERGPLPISEAVDYVLQALQALAQAHALGIVHRDVKPSNLFLARHPDGSNVLKVLDFGISKASPMLGQIVDGNSTSTHVMLGSPLYMAPEQARNAKAVDARADVWAVGVVLYRLLAGQVPFKGASLAELLMVIAQDEPASLRELRPELPAGLDGVVRRCLCKKPDERFPSVAELATTLLPFGGADAVQRVERICRTLSGRSASTSTPSAIATSQPQSGGTLLAPSGAWAEAKPATTGTWAESKPDRRDLPRSSRGPVLPVSVAAVIAVALAAAGTLALRAKHPAAAESEPRAPTREAAAHGAAAPPADDSRIPPAGREPPVATRAVPLKSPVVLPSAAPRPSPTAPSGAARSPTAPAPSSAGALPGGASSDRPLGLGPPQSASKAPAAPPLLQRPPPAAKANAAAPAASGFNVLDQRN